jgi:hypothetical protein
LTEQQTSKQISFWAKVQYNRRVTIPPVICDIAKIADGKRVKFIIEEVTAEEA